MRLLVRDLPPNLLPLCHELRHLARAGLRIDDLAPRRFQFPRHLDQRDAVQPRRDVVEQVGGLGVAERRQLLHLAEADGEDVVERRFVDVGEQSLHELVAVPGAVGRGDCRFVQPRIAVG